jgi:TPR repeat protein
MAKIEMMGEGMAEISPNMATAGMLLSLGMRYWLGREVEQDVVTAHKWFNLAAMKGSEDARIYRCELAREMSGHQLQEALRQARAWLTLH